MAFPIARCASWRRSSDLSCSPERGCEADEFDYLWPIDSRSIGSRCWLVGHDGGNRSPEMADFAAARVVTGSGRI